MPFRYIITMILFSLILKVEKYNMRRIRKVNKIEKVRWVEKIERVREVEKALGKIK